MRARQDTQPAAFRGNESGLEGRCDPRKRFQAKHDFEVVPSRFVGQLSEHNAEFGLSAPFIAKRWQMWRVRLGSDAFAALSASLRRSRFGWHKKGLLAIASSGDTRTKQRRLAPPTASEIAAHWCSPTVSRPLIPPRGRSRARRGFSPKTFEDSCLQEIVAKHNAPSYAGSDVLGATQGDFVREITIERSPKVESVVHLDVSTSGCWSLRPPILLYCLILVHVAACEAVSCTGFLAAGR